MACQQNLPILYFLALILLTQISQAQKTLLYLLKRLPRTSHMQGDKTKVSNLEGRDVFQIQSILRN